MRTAKGVGLGRGRKKGAQGNLGCLQTLKDPFTDWCRLPSDGVKLEATSPDAQLVVLPALCAASMEKTGFGSSDNRSNLPASVVRPLHMLLPLSGMLSPAPLTSSRFAETLPP